MGIMTHLFCFGYGECARALVLRTFQEWDQITVTQRKITLGKGVGREVFFPFDGKTPLVDPSFKTVTHLLVSIPPGSSGDRVLLSYGSDFSIIFPNLKWVGYLSSTSVYGDHAGALVSETSSCHPVSLAGQYRLLAEKMWLDFHKKSGVQVHVFRLAGLYGPSKNPLLSLKKGKKICAIKPGHVFSRIHVFDVAGFLGAAMNTPSPFERYNLCDDHPCPCEEVYRYGCELLSLPPLLSVPFEQAGLSDQALRFYQESKRVSNAKAKAQLAYTLAYPSYREGLRACLV